MNRKPIQYLQSQFQLNFYPFKLKHKFQSKQDAEPKKIQCKN